MKRALLIAGGTLGGLGAVLAITPPQLGATSMMDLGSSSSSASGSIAVSAGASSASTTTANANATATAGTSKSVVPVANQLALPTKCGDDEDEGDDYEGRDEDEGDDNYNCKQAAVTPAPVATKATAAATKAPAATKTTTATKTKAAAPVKTTAAAPASKAVNGTFTGPSVFVNYGNVQVKITVSNGKITDAVAVVAPSGRNDRYTNMAVPILKKQTLAAQSASINGASGASYTSFGWQKSLQGALANAGL